MTAVVLNVLILNPQSAAVGLRLKPSSRRELMILYLYWSEQKKRMMACVAELRNYLVREMQVCLNGFSMSLGSSVQTSWEVTVTCMCGRMMCTSVSFIDCTCCVHVEQTAAAEEDFDALGKASPSK